MKIRIETSHPATRKWKPEIGQTFTIMRHGNPDEMGPYLRCKDDHLLLLETFKFVPFRFDECKPSDAFFPWYGTIRIDP